MSELEKDLQKRNMHLMVYHLNQARAAYKRYKDNKGKQSFHFTTEEWTADYGVEKSYNFDESLEEAIFTIEEEIEACAKTGEWE